MEIPLRNLQLQVRIKIDPAEILAAYGNKQGNDPNKPIPKSVDVLHAPLHESAKRRDFAAYGRRSMPADGSYRKLAY